MRILSGKRQLVLKTPGHKRAQIVRHGTGELRKKRGNIGPQWTIAILILSLLVGILVGAMAAGRLHLHLPF